MEFALARLKSTRTLALELLHESDTPGMRDGKTEPTVDDEFT
jgi:hypothetical protein